MSQVFCDRGGVLSNARPCTLHNATVRRPGTLEGVDLDVVLALRASRRQLSEEFRTFVAPRVYRPAVGPWLAAQRHEPKRALMQAEGVRERMTVGRQGIAVRRRWLGVV
jgi:hypothetical protein